MTMRDELISIYSDMYKEHYGFRPRHMGEWTEARLQAAIDSLASVPVNCDDEPYVWDGSGEVDHVTASQPTSGDGWAFVPAG